MKLRSLVRNVTFLLLAVENIPVLEVLSDLMKCSVESILEHDASKQETSSHQHKSGKKSTRDCGASVPLGTSCGLNKSHSTGNSEALGDAPSFHNELNFLTRSPLPSDIQIKEECDDVTPPTKDVLRAAAEGSQNGRLPPQFSGLKSYAGDTEYPPTVSERIENDADSESQSDGSSLSNDDTSYDIDNGQRSPDPAAAASFHRNHVQKNSKLTKLMPKFSKQGICPHCGVYYGNLSQHIFTYCSQNPERRRVFHCCYCKFKSQSKEELVEHKTSHVLLRDFKCEMCDSGFFTRNRLIRHMRYVHLIGNNPVKIYTCDTCNKRFRYRSHYDRHITIHQGVCVFHHFLLFSCEAKCGGVDSLKSKLLICYDAPLLLLKLNV